MCCGDEESRSQCCLILENVKRGILYIRTHPGMNFSTSVGADTLMGPQLCELEGSLRHYEL